MAAAAVDMNVTVISMNLDILEQQRAHMHRAVDEYVDQVLDTGRQWVTRGERKQSTFLEIHKTINKTMVFLSVKCDEMKSELESETSNLIARDEFTLEQKNACVGSADKPVTTHGSGKDGIDVKQTHTFTNPNFGSDQQTKYQDVYNQLKSVLAKQDELEQQLNMKLNNLREDTESLKSDVATFNQYVETGKSLLKDYSLKLESLENTVSCLSGNVNEMHSDHQVLVDRINSHLSAKDDQGITDLSAKVDQITTDLTDKIDQITTDLSAKVDQITTDLTDNIDQVNKDLSAKVGHINIELSDKADAINTDLSAKVDQITVALQFLANIANDHAAQKDKITDLEKHVNTTEKDTQNNDKKAQQRLDEVGKKLLDVTTKLTFLTSTVDTCAKKSDLGAVGFNAMTTFQHGLNADSVVGKFGPRTFIRGFDFDYNTGIFTAPSAGVYLVYVSMCLNQDGYTRVDLIREYEKFDEYDDPYQDHVCMVEAKRKNSTEHSLNIITMGQRDKLFIRTHENPIASCEIQLLCYRIG